MPRNDLQKGASNVPQNANPRFENANPLNLLMSILVSQSFQVGVWAVNFRADADDFDIVLIPVQSVGAPYSDLVFSSIFINIVNISQNTLTIANVKHDVIPAMMNAPRPPRIPLEISPPTPAQ